ncbi:NlpC/P60 family protein [Bacillus sp. OK048]|uniref:C40 family peptidase n=1 Tax=Bacillus sp. OK048 TaxID=1882761 RepID=UPI00088AAA57|nr:C40 family peptidase [Bacillus sp. OK048]SDN16039.1 N-terminal domain of peptidoglycan hydrolase CwlO-containing protein [Bacillus sp. OK048]
MKKKIMAFCTIITFGSPTVLLHVDAEENNNQQVIDEQRSKLQLGILKGNIELNNVKNEIEQINAQIGRVEQAIIDNNNIILETEEKIKISQLKIQEMEKEILALNDKVSKRHEILKKRALTFQELGGKVNYLDVLLGSSSFKDFVDRVGAVASLIEADQDLVKQHETDKQTVKTKQAEVKGKLIELQSMNIELEGMQSQILEQKLQNELLRSQLKEKEQVKLAEQAGLMQQDSVLATMNDLRSMDPAQILSSSLLFSNKTVESLITEGLKYIGNSVYVFGGGRNDFDIANGRFDCSAFVSWAFSQVNINIGASTEALKNTGTAVSVEEMLPGDLVFFDTYKIDGHVGIYLGAGKFLGSQSSTGVAIADMTNGYWLEKFNGRVNRLISESFEVRD